MPFLSHSIVYLNGSLKHIGKFSPGSQIVRTNKVHHAPSGKKMNKNDLCCTMIGQFDRLLMLEKVLFTSIQEGCFVTDIR